MQRNLKTPNQLVILEENKMYKSSTLEVTNGIFQHNHRGELPWVELENFNNWYPWKKETEISQKGPRQKIPGFPNGFPRGFTKSLSAR